MWCGSENEVRFVGWSGRGSGLNRGRVRKRKGRLCTIFLPEGVDISGRTWVARFKKYKK